MILITAGWMRLVLFCVMVQIFYFSIYCCGSPDLNLIELVWHALKDFVQQLLHNMEELTAVIVTFWTKGGTNLQGLKVWSSPGKMLVIIILKSWGAQRRPMYRAQNSVLRP